MNIIEKEIAKRQAIIDGKAEKIAKREELQQEIAKLDDEIAKIDIETLQAEIEELKTFLPQEIVSEDQTIVEVE